MNGNRVDTGTGEQRELKDPRGDFFYSAGKKIMP